MGSPVTISEPALRKKDGTRRAKIRIVRVIFIGVRNRNLTAEAPLPAGRQGERREVIFLFVPGNPGTNKKLPFVLKPEFHRIWLR
jgi:hypothetical protein